MFPNAHAEENGAHTPPYMPAVFLTHASPPSHIAADSELINAALFGSRRNRWVRGGKGFNRRVSISVLHTKASDLIPLGAPKLMACAAGIESVRYDFDRFLPLQKQERRDAVKRHLVTFPKGIPLGLSRKESNVVGYVSNVDSLSSKEGETLSSHRLR
jgi:hypothetical protein